jgi:hypothetical protein
MMTRRQNSLIPWVLVVAFALLAAHGDVRAGVYPVNKCVSTKIKTAAGKCKKALEAWGAWDKTQDDTKRDAALDKAATKFSDTWAKADQKAAKKGVDCADTTLSDPNMQALINAGIDDIVAAINDGLDLINNKDDRKCGGKLLKLAAGSCDKILKAEARYISQLAKDPDGVRRAADRDKARTKFSEKWDDASLGCPTHATKGAIETSIDDLSAAVVLNTTVSPNVDDTQFITISPMGMTEYQGKELRPICADGSAYHFFAKRGSVNKLLMYYQGGGACWESLTCGFGYCYSNMEAAADENPKNGWSSGFADLTNPDNPFKDWNIVFVSYCSCDAHFGDIAQDYPPHVDHRGYHNGKVAEKWAREHFLNPEVVLVTGTSAGAYGGTFHAPLLREVWPASGFHVLVDAGNGVITPDFLQNEWGRWNFVVNLPLYIPGVAAAIEGTGVPAYIIALAAFFPDTNWAHYTTAFDGTIGGQSAAYNIMLNENNPAFALWWWEASCAFNEKMREQALDTAQTAASNYRYYIGTGSEHGMWNSNKVYTDTTGGVATVVDWVNAMIDNDPNGWVNVEASPSNVLLPGDPKPEPLEAPFEQSDPNDPNAPIIVNCTP